MLHILEIEQNAEGNKLAYLSPADENGDPKSGYRIAGPKAWGGSRNLAKLKVGSDDLTHYIKKYAPEIMEKLNEDKRKS